MNNNHFLPRPEYPRPQFKRNDWINLNGQWTYSFDFGKSGIERGFAESRGFDGKITVPFCPESSLSGVGFKDFIEMMWYHRIIKVPHKWKGKTILLHFGAVDYESEVFIDGKSAGRHWGGTSSFCLDITHHVHPGKRHNLVVWVKDETRSNHQPCGKQSGAFKSNSCYYTRTTGIWQTVWLEAVSEYGLERDTQIIPDLDGEKLIILPRFLAVKQGHRFRVSVKNEDKTIAQAECSAFNGISCEVSIKNPKEWTPERPFLYDLFFEIIDGNGNVIDSVKSYAGMRKIHIEGNRIFLNNKPCYLRFVLDQGFYPDGIWTAPSDEALKKDIELSKNAGFNGARLHQKVFEERFHYWADKLGYLTWGESSSWGFDIKSPLGARNFLSEWREIVVRDRNHPSIITWTPFNETCDVGDGYQHYRAHIDAYKLTKDLDPTRPINDTSGYVHVKTDIWTVHHYEQDPKKLFKILKPDPKKGVFRRYPDKECDYGGQPYILDEFGGTKWIPENRKPFADNSWGIGDDLKTVKEFYDRLEGLVKTILGFTHICGFCYTQLTDVEQEENGIYNYDRSEKFNMKRIAGIFNTFKILKGA
ncbi:MAG: beta-glucuronidase [Candidatus Raymondbacteria bacterium RifOxyA12_full_50_37]|uniref:Beta-glucuronidase n=1 Tax=Candidatus Raymondbacteria bacterium RIFOXYD12_FULL_49_13 TaxID=1817890 RepID=A0A1F7F8R4_UNCRA|nr:MAG: beta-glucuronidase [Candidatus Raymondbacteria bacterium RifOxyA12_full_50_37]OGJ91513.1 MAG: beta-glucuronidase [Candidatus Raymondbacteria bacterium RIFOXYA2_FULL_49_16]OGJ93063.1 MAG: beta-glucuronidase [Candidatus Raymondbacteria bacterium RifOxyB12_full_50_8]OGJ97827.1 MAG: beta-glucuronidase [Candidatus Raymondbacteria bacterium RIFOXYC2_FULL_50_21]OGK02113.1 MAG: beta-glucuronidase [Candidatus Raymondbacteria bacterium RifOxyC12_full_50_8]OGK02978.1 MAG: beta-glucuronidase [Cand